MVTEINIPFKTESPEHFIETYGEELRYYYGDLLGFKDILIIELPFICRRVLIGSILTYKKIEK